MGSVVEVEETERCGLGVGVWVRVGVGVVEDGWGREEETRDDAMPRRDVGGDVTMHRSAPAEQCGKDCGVAHVQEDRRRSTGGAHESEPNGWGVIGVQKNKCGTRGRFIIS
jgi:hypothetical protein